MTSSALNAVNEYLMLKALVENAAAQAKRRFVERGMKEGAVVTGNGNKAGNTGRPAANVYVAASLNERVDFKLFLQLEHAIKNK